MSLAKILTLLRLAKGDSGGDPGGGGGGDAVTAGIIYDEVDADGNPVKVTVRGKVLPSHAFRENKTLTDVVLLSGLKSIGDYAFRSCSALTELNIPDSVESLGKETFSYSGLVALDLPASLGVIPQYMCSYCQSLTAVSIPNGVTEISKSAFSSCSNLESAVLPSTITTVGDSAFGSCSKAVIVLSEGLVNIGVRAFDTCTAMIKRGVTIPASVETIGNYAFTKNSSNGGEGAISVTFKGTPTSISSTAFQIRSGGGIIFNVPWAEGEVANAPWGATDATINYNYTGE